MFAKEVKDQLFIDIQKTVETTLIEFRQSYPPPQDISSPHLPLELSIEIASELDEVSEKNWTPEKQAATVDTIINTANRCIVAYRSVYPPSAALSSPHIPKIIAARVVGLIDDIVHNLARDRRILEATRKEKEASDVASASVEVKQRALKKKRS